MSEPNPQSLFLKPPLSTEASELWAPQLGCSWLLASLLPAGLSSLPDGAHPHLSGRLMALPGQAGLEGGGSCLDLQCTCRGLHGGWHLLGMETLTHGKISLISTKKELAQVSTWPRFPPTASPLLQGAGLRRGRSPGLAVALPPPCS